MNDDYDMQEVSSTLKNEIMNMTFYTEQEQKYYPVIPVWYSKACVWTGGDQCPTEDLPGGTGNSSHTGTGAVQMISPKLLYLEEQWLWTIHLLLSS